MTDQSRQRLRIARRGFALLIVLLLLIALSIVVYILQREVSREVFVSANMRDDLSAAYLANMGLVRGQVVLRLDSHSDYDSLNEPWAKPLRWEGETFGEASAAEGNPEPGARPAEPQVLISDEERKFNLLTLVRGTEEQRTRAIEVFTRLINICRRTDERLADYMDGEVRTVRRADDDSANTDTLVRNLLKYLDERVSEDSDDLEFTSETGDKSDQRSMKKQTPYQMLTLGELLQVEGWTHELLHGPLRVASASNPEGEDNRGFYELNDEEKFERTRKEIEDLDLKSRDPNPLPLVHYLTLYSSGRININTCSRELLLAMDERLTWDVVDRIITAREQDRRDVVAAEENGGLPPEEAPPEDPTAEPEDKASFRPQDLATYAAFVARATNEETAEGQQPTLEGFTEEIYTAIRPWLVVRSTVFRVEASAKVGKMTNTIYAIYRRTGSNQAAAAPAAPGQPGQPAAPAAPAPAAPTTGEAPLPDEPKIKLTLLFKDVK